MRPLDPATPQGQAAERDLNAVLAAVARRRERERREAALTAGAQPAHPISKPA